MSKFTFRNEDICDDEYDNTTEVTFHSETLDDVLVWVRQFLQGCGYKIEGGLEVVGEDEAVVERVKPKNPEKRGAEVRDPRYNPNTNIEPAQLDPRREWPYPIGGFPLDSRN